MSSMEMILLASLVVTILALAILLTLALRFYWKSQETTKEIFLSQNQLLSKLTAVVVSKDAMTFQAIQTMDGYQASLSDSSVNSEQEYINDILDRINAGEEVTPDEYDRVERAVLANE